MSEVILTTMCAIVDEMNNKVLFINRKKNWPGYAFPGGHVEHGESITDCVIREVKEETGLSIFHVKFKGIAHFYNNQTKSRYMVFNYYTNHFSGDLIDSCEEGEICWVPEPDICSLKLAEGMEKRLDLFFDQNEQREMFVEWNSEGDDQKVTYLKM